MVESEFSSLCVGVLQGGVSSEREISLLSGAQVLSALERNGIPAKGLDVTTRDGDELKKIITGSGMECAFIALHGEFGEDGRIQRILEELAIPYTGSGPQASRDAMNKISSKRIFQQSGIATPAFVAVSRGRDITEQCGYPCVVKPCSGGSSLGVRIVHEPGDLRSAVEEAFLHGDEVVIEEYIEGRECTVGILESRPLGVVEIIPGSGYYDFHAKYTDGVTEFVAPARLPEDLYEAVRAVGLRAHEALGCRDFSRVDIRLSPEGIPYVLEVNSIPGFTSHSLLPLSARCMGIDFDALVKIMIGLALKRKVSGQERMTGRYGT